MTTKTTETMCGHGWCLDPEHRMCDCAYAAAHPHPRAGCRYRRDDPPEQPAVMRDDGTPTARDSRAGVDTAH